MARGPAYPYVNLEEAIGLARKMYVYTKRTAALTDSVVKDAWGASPTSSSSVKIVAAMKYFGLIEDLAGPAGKESSKLIKLTDRAYRIIVDSEDSLERKQAIIDAALSPKSYQTCWNKWGKELPASMRSSLLFEHGFVASSVDSFLKDYKQTIEYAGLLKADDSLKAPESRESGSVNNNVPIKVGDYVQWESQGVLQFKPARRVIRIMDDGYAFVEGSNTGILVAELTLAEKSPEVPPKISAVRPLLRTEAKGMRQEIFSMSEGSVSIEWPSSISAESFEDFKDWLKILERKIGRSVGATTNDKSKEKPDSTSDF